MKLFIHTILFIFLLPITCHSQDSTSTIGTERKAKLAVYQIVRHSGLVPNFNVVELDDISTAVAYQKGKKRYIGYNPQFLKRLTLETGTDWSAISVMAHEIGHHLLGHTMHPPTSFSEELEADKYSGFILFQMGASLEETLAAIVEVGHQFDSLFHPSHHLRQQTIKAGWLEAQQLKEGNYTFDMNDSIDASIVSKVKFINDRGNYYINNQNDVLLFNSFAQPVKIGKVDSCDKKSYQQKLLFDKETYYVDSKGNIWNITLNEMVFPIGKISSTQ